MGESHIWVGYDTEPFSNKMSKCTQEFYDTGFQPSLVPCTGDRIVIRRDGGSNAIGSHRFVYNLFELRPYQTPNLLQLLEGNVTISAPASSDPKYAATNLITNLDNRSSGTELLPLVDLLGTEANHESCFKTTST